MSIQMLFGQAADLGFFKTYRTEAMLEEKYENRRKAIELFPI